MSPWHPLSQILPPSCRTTWNTNEPNLMKTSLLILSLSLLLVATSWAVAKTPLQILPLGDSITEGQEFGSYRTQLWKDFGSNPSRVKFLGSQSSGPDDLGDRKP